MDELEDFEIITAFQLYKGKLSIYFIESHLETENESIKVNLDSNNSSINNLIVVNQEKLKFENEDYIINVYKFEFQPSKIDRKKIKFGQNDKTIEIKIILEQNNCIFESIKEINIEKDNFLGVIKFEEYKWYLGLKYQPPIQPILSDLRIMKFFINVLTVKENKNKADSCFIELLKYGISLLKQVDNYEYELFILIYINTFYNEKGNLIQDILDIFDIDKVKINNNLSILDYLDELENIYKNQCFHLEKINKSEKYLIQFYTVYIYYLSKLKQKEKLLDFFNELINNNKYDKLILPKLYLSKYFSFYKTLIVFDEIKTKLAYQFINASNSYNDLLNSFYLISEFLNKNFIKILICVSNNYDKINNICFKEKKLVKLNDYFIQDKSNKDELLTIQNCLNLIITKKKENNYEPVKIDISSYIYFIYNKYNQEFLHFMENNLLDNIIKFEDIEDALLFSSQLRYKQFIPLLEIIINRIESISKICEKSHDYINIRKYIEKSEDDDLLKIKELILFIIQKEKVTNKFIKFNVNIWSPYINTNDLDKLKTIRKIIWNCKEIESEIDEDEIGLGKIIHNLGLELIRIGKLKGEKLTEFLGEDEAFYTDKKIKYLESENNQLKNKINDLDNEVGDIKYKMGKLKSEVESLSISNERLNEKVNILESDINNLKNKIYF